MRVASYHRVLPNRAQRLVLAGVSLVALTAIVLDACSTTRVRSIGLGVSHAGVSVAVHGGVIYWRLTWTSESQPLHALRYEPSENALWNAQIVNRWIGHKYWWTARSSGVDGHFSLMLPISALVGGMTAWLFARCYWQRRDALGACECCDYELT